MKLAGASVVVTGGASGIGLAVARRCLERGAIVTIAGRREHVLRERADELGSACRAVRADVGVAQDRMTLLAAAREHGGGVGAVVHCAGDLVSGPFTQLTQEVLVGQLANNLVGPLMLTSELVPDLARARGSVVFVSSAHAARAFAGSTAYSASKGALETVTRSLAVELGTLGVRVNCLRPGGVATEILSRSGLNDAEVEKRLAALVDLQALPAPGKTDDLADAAEYLLTSEWTTGTVLTVDGGLTLGAFGLAGRS